MQLPRASTYLGFFFSVLYRFCVQVNILLIYKAQCPHQRQLLYVTMKYFGIMSADRLVWHTLKQI